MPTKAEQIVNLEQWVFVQYGSEELARAGLERFKRYLQKKQYDAGLEVIG